MKIMRKGMEGKKKREFFKRRGLDHTSDESNNKNLNAKEKEMDFMLVNEKLFLA